MTWKYAISDDRSEMEVIDHTGSVIKTITNDGTGLKIPDDVVEVMRDEADKARQNGDTKRWRDIHIRLSHNDISLKG